MGNLGGGGRQFVLAGTSGWFAEPQLHSYLKVQGEDYALTNGMRVEEKNADSLMGRVGLVLGKTILDEKGNGWQIAVKSVLNHEFLGAEKIKVNGEAFDGVTLGTRGYCGLAVDWYATSRLRLFGQIEREQGAHYTGEYNARLAMKYAFDDLREGKTAGLVQGRLPPSMPFATADHDLVIVATRQRKGHVWEIFELGAGSLYRQKILIYNPQPVRSTGRANCETRPEGWQSG